MTEIMTEIITGPAPITITTHARTISLLREANTTRGITTAIETRTTGRRSAM
jgi:hypothetical protein